jgi:hypothetical protein
LIRGITLAGQGPRPLPVTGLPAPMQVVQAGAILTDGNPHNMLIALLAPFNSTKPEQRMVEQAVILANIRGAGCSDARTKSGVAARGGYTNPLMGR